MLPASDNHMERRRPKVEAKKLGPLLPEEVINHTWCIEEEISAGAFGAVYKAFDLVKGNYVAIKASKTLENSKRSHIRWEAKVYEQFKGSSHCPKMIAYDVNTTPHFLVLELLGPSLSYLVKRLKSKALPKGIVAAIIKQCLGAIKDLHNACFIHRDVKPSNFAVGSGSNRSKIYIIDFGLCRKYCHEKGCPFSERFDVGFRGTVRYASTRAHFKKDLCRADDLTSLFYMAYELLAGQLPWKHKSDTNVILSMKLKLPPTTMAEALDVNFKLFAEHLNYTSEPNYEMIEALLVNVMQEDNVDENTLFGWEHLLKKEEENISKHKQNCKEIEEQCARKAACAGEEEMGDEK
ncbi:hypothetical protein D918_07943 [Trichuris suis]|nr:hypothetical protein D918_07943 [Trichuris suis]